MNIKKTETEKQTICRMALILMNDESLQLNADDIEEILFAYMNKNNVVSNGSHDVDLIHDFVYEINRLSLNINHVQTAYEKHFLNEVHSF